MSVAEAAPSREWRERAAVGRCLLVLWQNPQTRLISPIGFLAYDGARYSFSYIRHALFVEGFRPLVGFNDLHREYRADELFPLFAQRAMDPRRRDYVRFVERLALDADSTPWEQIARSGGRRPGDTLQLLPVPTQIDGRVELTFMVNGMRHVTRPALRLHGREVSITEDRLDLEVAHLLPGAALEMREQPDNDYSSDAIMIMTRAGVPLGWVPDVLVHDVHALRRSAPVTVSCEVANPADAPWHLRLLVRAAAQLDRPFSFFTDERFDRLVDQ